MLKFDVSNIFPVYTKMYAQYAYLELRLPIVLVKTFANPYNKRHLIKLFLDSRGLENELTEVQFVICMCGMVEANDQSR